MSVLGDDVAKARVAAALLLTAPGVPFLYYGEEIGMIGAKPDEQIRTPMQWADAENAGFSTGKPWIEVKPNYTTSNVATESAAPASLLTYYRTLIHLRNEHEALRVGDYTKLDAGNNKLYAFWRRSAQETVLVLIVLGDTPITDCRLMLAQSDLLGARAPVELLTQAPLSPLPLPQPAGGVSEYRPLAELAAQTAYIIRW